MRNDPDFQLIDKSTAIWSAEIDIDFDESLYLITWSPDPSELPNADFTTQHLYNVNLLSGYLKQCQSGLFCVESTQMGNPHYHGWYQVSPDPIKEQFRCVYIKTLNRFGLLRITKSKGNYKINSYNKQANTLHYYKKDVYDSMLWCNPNPITEDSYSDIDWNNNLLYFVKEGRGTVADLEEKVSLKEFYIQFYKDSDTCKSRIG